MTYDEYKKKCHEKFKALRTVWSSWPYSNMHIRNRDSIRLEQILFSTRSLYGPEYLILVGCETTGQWHNGRPLVGYIRPSDSSEEFIFYTEGNAIRDFFGVRSNDPVVQGVEIAKGVMDLLDKLIDEVKFAIIEDKRIKLEKETQKRLARDKAVLDILG